MSNSVIVFRDVSKSYPFYHHIGGGIKHFLFHFRKAIRSLRSSTSEVLTNVSFAVKSGETFGIIGRNGAGKSTTLGLIAGVLEPTSGEVVVRDRVSPLLELGAGFHPELSGTENIELNGVLLGLSRREVLKKVNQIVDFSGIGDHADQPIRTYSDGMVARLGFSVVAHLSPKILLIDEILAVGDLAFQRKCYDKMEEFKESGVTMVFVSHSEEDVERLCDRVMWIENHRVKSLGPPAQVIQTYAQAVA